MTNRLISINPATLEEIASVPRTPPDEVERLIAVARDAQPAWEHADFEERAKKLLRARCFLLDTIASFAETITKDNGKPLAEAITAEIYPVADLIYHFAHRAEKLLRPFRQPIGIMGVMRRSSRIEYLPRGVIGIISPWNYPFSIPVGAAAMALMAGNAVMLKPSSITPLVGVRIAEMFEAAGLPAGVFTHLPGDASTGQALIDCGPDKLVFTGSVGVGKTVMAGCAATLTSPVLELGGKDPMIVRADADIDHASSGAVWGAFTNCGQTCAAVERVYVHHTVYEEFLAAVVEKTTKLIVGNGMDEGVDVGPLTTESQRQIVEAHIADARTRGGRIECGGKRPEGLAGYFYLPTVITGVDHTFMCMREETFGPLMPIMTFTDDEEAVRLANDSRFGLTASVWTRDIVVGQAMARRIQAGTVTINEAVYTHALCQTPWGGIKESGIGVSHGRFGLMEFIRPHHVHTNRWLKKSMWWYPYGKELYERFLKLAGTLTGSRFDKLASFPTLLKTLIQKKTN